MVTNLYFSVLKVTLKNNYTPCEGYSEFVIIFTVANRLHALSHLRSLQSKTVCAIECTKILEQKGHGGFYTNFN